MVLDFEEHHYPDERQETCEEEGRVENNINDDDDDDDDDDEYAYSMQLECVMVCESKNLAA